MCRRDALVAVARLNGDHITMGCALYGGGGGGDDGDGEDRILGNTVVS